MKTVDQLVRGALANMQLPIHYYAQALSYALEFLQTNVEHDSLGTLTRVALTLDADREAALPSDFDQVVNVAYNRGNYLVYIPEERQLKDLDSSIDVGDETLVVIPYTNYYYSNFVNTYGEHLGKYYGLHSGAGEHYSIDNNKLICGYAFSENETVYLEYLSTTRYLSSTVVDSRFHEAVREWVRYQFYDWDRTRNLGEKDRAKKRYTTAYRAARRRTNALSKQEWLNLFRINTRISPKA